MATTRPKAPSRYPFAAHKTLIKPSKDTRDVFAIGAGIPLIHHIKCAQRCVTIQTLDHIGYIFIDQMIHARLKRAATNAIHLHLGMHALVAPAFDALAEQDGLGPHAKLGTPAKAWPSREPM